MAWETAATQMLERTLDDSAGRRIYIPDAFRATDAILILCMNVVDGLVLNRGVINTRLDAELPFMATEAMIMKAVEKGADRQIMHGKIRDISMEVGRLVKEKGLTSYEIKETMVRKVGLCDEIPLLRDEIIELLDASRLIGRCPGQVTDYLLGIVNPLLKENSGEILVDSDVKV